MDASVIQRALIAFTKLQRSVNAELLQHEEIDVTGPQMFMLIFISRRERCRLAEIAERFDVKPSAVTVMVDRLEKRGYVRRMQDTADRRSTLVELTPEGRKMLGTAVRVRGEVLNGYLSKLAPGEDMLLVELLEKMAGPLDMSDLSYLESRDATN